MSGRRNLIVGALAAGVMLASASATAQSCPSGQAASNATYGHCCWPGQIWSNSRSRCVGDPTCPSGMSASGDDCVPANGSTPMSNAAAPVMTQPQPVQSEPAQPTQVQPVVVQAQPQPVTEPVRRATGDAVAPLGPLRTDPDDATQVGIIPAVRRQYGGPVGPALLGVGGGFFLISVIGWGVFGATIGHSYYDGGPAAAGFLMGVIGLAGAAILVPIGAVRITAPSRITVDPVDGGDGGGGALRGASRDTPIGVALRASAATANGLPGTMNFASWSVRF